MEAPRFLANLFDLPANASLPLVLAGAALAFALLAVVALTRFRTRNEEDQEQMKQRLDTLWREMDELRVEQFNGASAEKTDNSRLDPDHLAIEKAAYDQLWPLICTLHDKLGTFLRAVETGEPASESRLSARNAALDARTTLNNVRPFCYERIDDLATQLIDMEIKAHLAGCQYQDLRKETGNQEEGEREHLHQKFRMLYDGESRELMTQLIEAIRHRMIKRSGS